MAKSTGTGPETRALSNRHKRLLLRRVWRSQPTEPSRPSPMSTSVPTTASSAVAGAQTDQLRHRVSLYLARVVKALADFEDALLKEDGFFARSDHFEAQVDTLRGEFEADERAQTIFSKPEPVQLLLGQLTTLCDESEPEPASARRRQQFVFAASVLLTSKTTVHTMLAHPALLTQLWDFIKQPSRLHPVQLQYW